MPQWLLCQECDFQRAAALPSCLVSYQASSWRWSNHLQVLTEATYKGNAADVWSLGVMLYVMIEGAFPFRLRRQRYQMQKMIGRIINAEYKRPTHVRLCMWHVRI